VETLSDKEGLGAHHMKKNQIVEANRDAAGDYERNFRHRKRESSNGRISGQTKKIKKKRCICVEGVSARRGKERTAFRKRPEQERGGPEANIHLTVAFARTKKASEVRRKDTATKRGGEETRGGRKRKNHYQTMAPRAGIQSQMGKKKLRLYISGPEAPRCSGSGGSHCTMHQQIKGKPISRSDRNINAIQSKLEVCGPLKKSTMKKGPPIGPGEKEGHRKGRDWVLRSYQVR